MKLSKDEFIKLYNKKAKLISGDTYTEKELQKAFNGYSSAYDVFGDLDLSFEKTPKDPKVRAYFSPK